MQILFIEYVYLILIILPGLPFPFRNLILFITFIVILVALVFQGLTLPWFIRKVRPEDKFANIPEQEQELIIQKKIAQETLQFLEEKYGEAKSSNAQLKILYEKLKIEQNFLNREFQEIKDTSTRDNSINSYQKIVLEVLEHQRKLLNRLNHMEDYDEELIRKYFSLIDLEEFKIREKLLLPDVIK
jgi:monovalent cation/hydrogen antiporter